MHARKMAALLQRPPPPACRSAAGPRPGEHPGIGKPLSKQIEDEPTVDVLFWQLGFERAPAAAAVDQKVGG
jgi:hypothetical protein